MKRRTQRGGPAATLICLVMAVAAGCATITHGEPPPDWPQLKRVELRTSLVEVQRLCAPARANMTPVAFALSLGLVAQCALINFLTSTCTKVRPIDETDGDDHEEDHCAGKDHIGESVLADAWAGWKARKVTP